MISSSTRSWISSTFMAWPRDRQLVCTWSLISMICSLVKRWLSGTTWLALVMAAIIFVMSKTASLPLRLMIFMLTLLTLIYLKYTNCIQVPNVQTPFGEQIYLIAVGEKSQGRKPLYIVVLNFDTTKYCISNVPTMKMTRLQPRRK